MFLNKLDRAGASFHSSLLSLLAHRLHPNPMVLTLPVSSFDPADYQRAEPGIQGLVDLVRWEVWKWNKEGQYTRHSLPTDAQKLENTDLFPPGHPVVPHLLEARTSLLDNLSMFSENLMEILLSLPSTPSAYLTVTHDQILPELRAATLRDNVLPVLCGSAFKHVGTELVMDYVGELLPSPVDGIEKIPKPNAPLRMLAWKVAWDKRKGWMTFVRIYSGRPIYGPLEGSRLTSVSAGTLKQQTKIYNATRGQRESVSKLLLLYASRHEEVEALPYGSVGVIIGCKFTRTGDTLVASMNDAEHGSLPNIVPPPAVMSTSIIPQSHADLQPVQDALHSLARTDPSVRIESQEGQILVHGLGSLHLEIVESRLRDEWNVQFEFGKRRVGYREGLGSGLDDTTKRPGPWHTNISGKPIEVSLDLDVRSLEEDENGDPLWDGNIILDKAGKPLPPPDSFTNQLDPMANVSRGISSSLSSSPHTSLPLSRLHIKVKGYHYPLLAPTSVLAGGSAVILREYLKLAGMGPLMEPYIRLKITVNEETLGKVVKDLTEHGGELLDLATSSVGVSEGDQEVGPYPQDGVYVPPASLSPSSSNPKGGGTASMRRAVHAFAPLSQMLDYSNRLRALSGGHGVFEMENAGFRQVHEARKLEILREMGRI